MKKLKSIAIILGFGILLTPISVGAQSFGECEIIDMLPNDNLFINTKDSFFSDRVSTISECIGICESRGLSFKRLKSHILDVISRQKNYGLLDTESKLIECSKNREECLFSLNALLNVYKTAARSRSSSETRRGKYVINRLG